MVWTSRGGGISVLGSLLIAIPPIIFGGLSPPAFPVVILGPLGSPWGPLALPWAFLPLVPFGFGPPPFWAFFCYGWALWALPGALWPSPGRLCPLCLLALFALPLWGPFFVLFWAFWALPGALWPSSGHPCPLCLLALFAPPLFGFFWALCAAIGPFFWAPWLCFGRVFAPCAFWLCLVWALCLSCVWPLGRLFCCACDVGACFWAFCAFALSFSLLPWSVSVSALACL